MARASPSEPALRILLCDGFLALSGFLAQLQSQLRSTWATPGPVSGWPLPACKLLYSPGHSRAANRYMSNASSSVRIVPAVVMSALLAVLCSVPPAHATAISAKALEGTWCSQNASSGETIVQYSAAGSNVTAFTVLSEADPRQVGMQLSKHLTAESPNVFVHRDANGADEQFSVQSERLTVDWLWIADRGTGNETRQVLATQTYYKCDVSRALQRAQAFLSSPKAEQATRRALQREANVKAAVEQIVRENAEMEERRNASKDAYYGSLIRQLSRARNTG
jgi:hypothetical protein